MSVRSIIGGDLTLDNLNVATINSSVYPPVVPTNTLTQVLTAGNSAGNLSITGVNNLAVTTINSAVYPPVVPADTLTQVLTAGNSAGNLNITGVNNLAVTTINGQPPASVVGSLTQVLTVGNSAGSLNITGVNDLGLTTINGSAYPPVIGQTTNGVGTTTTTSLNSTQDATIDTISLTPGVYNIVLSGTVAVNGTLANFDIKLSPTSIATPPIFIDSVLGNNVPTNVSYTPASSLVVVVAVTTTYFFVVNATFSGTSVTVTKPTSVGNHYITAIRLGPS